MTNKIITWEIDPSTRRFIYVSPFAAGMLGYPLEDWYEDNFWIDHIHPEDLERILAETHPSSRNGEDLELEYRMISANGEVWVRDFSTVETERGQPILFRGVLIDITEEKRQEQIRRETEMLYQQATRIANLGHWEWDLISERLITCSEEHARIYGLSVDEYIKTLSSLEDDISTVHQEDREHYIRSRKAYQEANACGPDSNAVFDTLYRMVNRDGEIRYLHEVAEPVFDDEGRHVRSIGTTQDITDHNKTETMNIRLGRIIEQSLNEVYCFDADTLKFEQVNQGACENLGYTLDEMKNLTPVDIKPGFTRDTFLEAIRPLRDGENEQIVFETVHQRKNGTTYSAEVHLQLFVTETPPVFVAIIQDITDRKKAEQELNQAHDELELRVHERTKQLQDEIEERKRIESALRETEQRVRDFAESSSDWFWEMGPDLKFSYLSESYEKFTGIDPLEVIGKSRKELAASGEDQKKWHDHLDDLDNHRPIRDFQYELQRADGNNIHVSISGNPVFDTAGEFAGYRGTATDFTTQVRLERRAATAEHQLADAIEGFNQGLILFDTEEQFVTCNSKYREVVEEVSDILVPGTTFEDLCRASFERGLVSGWDNIEQWVEARLARFREDTQPIIHQLRTGQWIMTTEHKTRNGSTLVIRTDVTDLKQTQVQLEEAKKAAEEASDFKSNFLANMSHELRTPLNAIIGFTDIMRQQAFGPIENEKYLEYIEDTHHSGKHLLELINDILDISAIEADKLELDREMCDVGEVIESSVKLAIPSEEDSGVSLTTNIDDDLPALHADRRRLMQVIINLLTNAVKFTPKEGDISVTASCADNAEILITITDTGIGMDDPGMEQAMAKFGRLDSNIARKTEGTGLGLPICKSLVEMHGGSFELSSTVGEGTTVRLMFPIKHNSGK